MLRPAYAPRRLVPLSQGNNRFVPLPREGEYALPYRRPVFYPEPEIVQSGAVLPHLTEAIADVSTSANQSTELLVEAADRNADLLADRVNDTGNLIAAALVGLTLGIVGAVLFSRSKPPVVVVVDRDDRADVLRRVS